jgi:hypothetical protein
MASDTTGNLALSIILGHFVINPIYDNAGDFDNGFASVAVGKGDDAKSGYLDKTGKVIWQPSN